MEDPTIVPIPSGAPNQPFSPPQPGSVRKVYPGSVGAMIMGIIAVVLCWYSVIPIAGFIFFIPALILGIIALKRGRKYEKNIQIDPEAYTKVSSTFLKVARITGLISIIAGSVMLLIGIVIIAAEDMPGHLFD